MSTAVRAAPALAQAHPSPAGGRVAYIDRLKVLLVAGIIAAHGVFGYSELEGTWPYQDVQEVHLAEVTGIVLGTLVLPVVLFVMGLFFLVSGLLTPGSAARKGPRRFARDRLVRLGLPLVAWVLVIWPSVKGTMQELGGGAESFWSEFVNSDPLLDAGPMWFVEVLLVYSLAYAAWCQWRGDEPGPAEARPLTGRTLVALAVGVSLATVLVRLVFPLVSAQPGQSHLWQWPQYLALFGLGIAAARRGWLDPVPYRIRHGCGVAALAAVVAMVCLLGAVGAAGLEPDVLFDLRLHWAPLGVGALEAPLAVGASVWLLALAQARLDQPFGRSGRALARSAYAAFIVQGVPLIALALAMRAIDVPAEVKALTVGCLGAIASFALALVLVTRTRLGRLL